MDCLGRRYPSVRYRREIRLLCPFTRPNYRVLSQAIITTPDPRSGAYRSGAESSVTKLGGRSTNYSVTRAMETVLVLWFLGVAGFHSRTFHLAVKAAESRLTSSCSSHLYTLYFRNEEHWPRTKKGAVSV